MANRDEIIAHLDDLLEIDSFSDYGPNGLQVPGAEEVTKVVTGVTALVLQLFESAAESVELVITHHGLFWDFHPRTISPSMKRRLQALFETDISLAAYHIPLDAHPEVGNNALICTELGLEQAERFADYKGHTIGFVGRSAEGLDSPLAPALRGRLRPGAVRLGRRPRPGPQRRDRVGQRHGEFGQAIGLRLDAFLTGEPVEHVMADARENHVHFIAAGHYATEVFGVRRLGELVAERFGVEHRFVDVPNPI